MAAAPDVLVLGAPFVLVREPVAAPAIVVAVGTQGPPGRNGVDGATISPDPNNQIQNRPNGLYVPPTEWGGTEW
ncbi:hypothetical protein [Ectopseudomonas alcaliphila]|uniref:Uncharacterized protein n=1 Tax=Ectopseudomonas alcaliphila TaxID=101564 RepID=A0A1G7MIK5_9GAMM|nr:hypothetical protein [Pseudomonas alcaliphila]MDX5994956.1 hypothetical protein [Pseudomonas alcaliphila]SDF61514.1 hypothetical protein SAMN05216575_10963 [Pseudomonas alcaliphila]